MSAEARKQQRILTSPTGRMVGDNGAYWNQADLIDIHNTFFQERKNAELVPQLVLNADIPLSERRDKLEETNGATITKQGAEYRLRATSTSGSNATLRTRQRANYLSGAELVAGIGLRIPVQPTGDAYVRWGLNDTGDGLFWQYDADGMKIGIRKASSDTFIAQTDWNMDTLDGEFDSSNPSGATLDPSDGLVTQIPLVYYGYGVGYFDMSATDIFKRRRMVRAHSYHDAGSIMVDRPNLPLSIEVDSGTTGVQLDVFVGGRQISSYGKGDGVARTSGAYRNVTGIGATDYVPLISFRHKTSWEQVHVRLQSVEIIPSDDAIWEIQRNGVLSGADWTTGGNGGAWGNHKASEQATEWDIDAGTTYTNGETIYFGTISGGNRISADKAVLPSRPISEFDTITLVIKSLGATMSAHSILKATEDW